MRIRKNLVIHGLFASTDLYPLLTSCAYYVHYKLDYKTAQILLSSDHFIACAIKQKINLTF